jgi:beta-phosphoglucomutase family hydrolase
VIDLALPAGIVACLFDLDGVLTQTADLHARAWKTTFDAFLRERADELHEPFVEFDSRTDYDIYVDGRPRLDGVRAFLESRDIHLPIGSPTDPTDAKTLEALAPRKNELVLTLIHEHGVEAYEGSVRLVRVARDRDMRLGVVSSSTNCRDVLEAAGIVQFFHTIVDGIVAEREHLRGKPAPDTFLVAAGRLGAEPAQAAVFEDALAGVEAGRAGGFGWVVGVDRGADADALRVRGADAVVADLSELLVAR